MRDEEAITPESGSNLLWNLLEPLCGLDSLDFHQIAIRPENAQLTAWSKLWECERRLAFYRWVEGLNLPGQHEYKALLGDAITAFLYTYEATLQFALKQFEATRGPKSFWDWADELTEYDLTVKGLRTLRHFEAHVVEMPHSVTVQVRMSEEIVSGETNTRTHKIYGLPALQPARLAGLRQPTPLDSTDLNAWNERVSKTSVADLFKYGSKS